MDQTDLELAIPSALSLLGEEPAQDVRSLTEVERHDLLQAAIAKYARKMNDSLNQFRPLPGAGESFMKSRARIQLATRSNRGGKTLHVAAKVARIFRGKGESLGFPAKNGRILAVGKDWEHVASVMWRKLAWPGAFQVVRDRETRLWRAVRPDPKDGLALDPDDVLRVPEWRPAAPLLPPAELEIAWSRKNRDEPARVIHKPTGWEIRWFSSEGDPRNGIDCDLVWFDEEILREQWVPESLMRLVDRDGRMIWSFTPQASTPQAYEFHKRAAGGDPTVAEFDFYIFNNPYLPANAKEEIRRALSPAEVAVRWYGEYAITSRRVYPQLNIHERHGFKAFPDGGAEPPDDWMCVFAVDPGFQVCGVLFGAVPPKSSPLFPALYIYDELYMRGSNCKRYGEELAAKARNRVFEAAIIDHKFGAQSQATSGRQLAEHHEDEHKRHRIRTHRTGTGFYWGSHDIPGRTDAVHGLLDMGRIKINRDRCPNLVRELDEEYYKKDAPDKRDERKYGHLVASLEYMAAYFDACGGIYYETPIPKEAEVEGSPAYHRLRRKWRNAKKKAELT